MIDSRTQQPAWVAGQATGPPVVPSTAPPGASRGWRVALGDPRVYLIALLALVAVHVVWWFPPGYLADSANTFAPSMPLPGSPLLRAYPWNPTQDGGFVNARLGHFLVTLPYYGLSGLGLDTWTAQAVWLFVVYWVGSVFVAFAAGEVFPHVRQRFWPLLLAGIAYQFAPGLWYKHIDSATYQLPIGFFWGVPLLFLVVLLAQRRKKIWMAPLIGAASLLFFTESSTALTLLPLVLPLLVGLFLWRSYREGRTRWALAFIGLALVWVVLFNLWWAVTEYQYRAELLASLATNTANQSVQPNHILNMLWFNPLYPTPPKWLPWLGTPGAVAALGAVFAVCVCAALGYRRSSGSLAVVGTWVASLLFVYSYGAPVGNLYVALIHTSFVLNMFRDAQRSAFVLDFLTACLFAAGAVWIYDRILAWAARDRAAAGAPRPNPAPGPPVRTRRRSRASVGLRVALPVGFVALLLLAGWPLLTGDLMVNTREVQGHQVYDVPYQPPQRGVAVPMDYARMRAWIASQSPYNNTMILPMPGPWIQDARGSNLSWGYQGTGQIYSNILGVPLILNDHEPLTSPSFSTVNAVYQLAETQGPAGAPRAIPITGNVTFPLPNRGSNDTVTYLAGRGPGHLGELFWSIGAEPAGATGNGHTFDLNVTHMPAGTEFLSLWVNTPIPGKFSVSWENATIPNATIPPYFLRANATFAPSGWRWALVNLAQSANGSAIPPTAGPEALANATQLGFHFYPNSTDVRVNGTIQIAGLVSYAPDPGGFPYYLESLGADLVVVDRALRTSSIASPQQNLTNYAPLLQALGPYRAAQFGNLTAYRLPNPPLPVEVATNWTAVSSAALAWSSRQPNQPFFVQSPPPWLRPSAVIGRATLTGLNVENSATYAVDVSSQTPFAVVLLQNYDPLWHAYVNGELVPGHFVANGFANGWWIGQVGNVRILLVFEPERTFEAAILGSAFAGSVLLVLTSVVGPEWIVHRFRRRAYRRARGPPRPAAPPRPSAPPRPAAPPSPQASGVPALRGGPRA